MNRFQQTFNRQQIVIDLGSFYTRVCLNGDLVFHQPTCLIRQQANKQVINFGKKALVLQDKLPPNTEFINPIQAGVVADQAGVESYLKLVLKKLAISDLQLWLSLPRGKYSLPAKASSLDKKILKQILSNIGLSRLKLISNPQAIYQHWLKINLVEPRSSLVLMDLGAQKTDLAVIIDGQIIDSFTLDFGTEEYTQKISQWLQQQYQLEVGKKTAEAIKRLLPDLLKPELLNLDSELSVGKLNVRGVDLAKQLVTTKTVNLKSLIRPLTNLSQKLARLTKLALSQIRSGGLVEAMDSGLYLTGGGSKTAGLADFMGQQLQTQSVISSISYFDTVKGLC